MGTFQLNKHNIKRRYTDVHIEVFATDFGVLAIADETHDVSSTARTFVVMRRPESESAFDWAYIWRGN